jgi:hypothetical protein
MVEHYVELITTASEERLRPAVELNAIDAFLMRQIVEYYPGFPIVIDLASGPTMGASIVFWQSQPNVSRIVSLGAADVGANNGDWRHMLQSALRELNSPKNVCWVNPNLSNSLCWEEALGNLRDSSPLMFSISTIERQSSSITKELQWMFRLSNNAVGFIFPLGKIGANGLLNKAIDFCSSESPYRLVALREVSPFFAASEVGLIFNRTNASIPAVLKRIQQLYDGNFNFLTLIENTVASVVARNTRSGEELLKNLIVSVGRRLHLDYDRLLVIFRLFPKPIRQYLKTRLMN